MPRLTTALQMLARPWRPTPAPHREALNGRRAARRRAALAGLLANLLASQRAAAAPLERAIYDLSVNGASAGSVIVLRSSDDIFVPMAALRDAGLTRLAPHGMNVSGVEYASLRKSRPELRVVIDEPELTLSIQAPAAALGQTIVDVTTPAPEGVWQDAEPSLQLSYAPVLIDLSQLTTYAEAHYSQGAWRTSTGVLDSEPRGRVVRLTSQIVVSDREHAREATLGDNFVQTGPLGSALFLGGVTVASNFGLNPYLVRVPALAYSGSALAPATVDIYDNGQLVRSVPVAPGEFLLRGLTPSAGAGNVRYVLRDALGHENRVERSYYASALALAPGLSEYTYALGFAREHYGVRSFEYRRPWLLAHHRLGLTRQLTVGARLDFGLSRWSGGADLLLAGGFGQLEFDWAASTDYARTTRRGAASVIAYQYQTRRASASTALRLTSRDYATADLSPAANRNLIEHSTNASVALGTRAWLSADLTLTSSRDAGLGARTGGGLSLQLGTGVFLQTSVARWVDRHFAALYEAFSTLNIDLGAAHYGTLSAHAAETGIDVTASASRPILGEVGVGYRASATRGALQRDFAQLQGQSPWVRGSASYYDDISGHHSILEAAGAVVWMPGTGFFLSRPISQSFAVVDVPDRPGLGVLLNHRKVGTTDSDGRLFLPNLAAYEPSRIQLDETLLSVNEELDGNDVLVSPPLRGGMRLSFDVRAVHVVRGRFVPRTGAGNLFAYGELRLEVRGETLRFPLGSAGEFELDQVRSGLWQAHVHSDHGDCDLLLPVPSDDTPIQYVGELPCDATLPADAR